MEEWVGNLWHKFITKQAETGFPDAGVELNEVIDSAPIFFRALGGDKGAQIKNAFNTENTKRRFLQRIAGTDTHIQLAWMDGAQLHLPTLIKLFSSRPLNRHLYLWLIALSVYNDDKEAHWLIRNKKATAKLLSDMPGWRHHYHTLVEAHVASRPNPDDLSATEAEYEKAIRCALAYPHQSLSALPKPAKFAPVPLWLHPEPPRSNTAQKRAANDDELEDSDNKRKDQTQKQRKGSAAKNNQDQAPMVLFFRAESILSWAENIGVNRATDDEEDDLAAADDMDSIAVQQDTRSRSSRVKFDLDLPSAFADDTVVREGYLLPEWDYQKAVLMENHCRIEEVLPKDATPCAIPVGLQREARKVKRQFQKLTPLPERLFRQKDGDSLDLDALVHHQIARKVGHAYADDGLYLQHRHKHRDLSCLLLADLSRSTEAGISDDKRVIDIIKDSLFLFSEALHNCGDRFALLGFSSRRRDPVRISLLKGFEEKYNAEVRGRIAAIKPSYYTRMGAAIRYATRGLQAQNTRQKLLLLLSDGKPNDIDQYEGRYGIEDTRHAILEAKRLGITPFCITIDQRGGHYLPYIFGASHFVLVRKTADLPEQLLSLYRQVSGNTQ